MHKVTKFGVIRVKIVRTNVLGKCVNTQVFVKLVRILYEFHTNLSQLVRFSHEPSCGSVLMAFTVTKMQPTCSPRFWAPRAEHTLNTGAPREQDGKRGMCNVQIAGIVEKDVTSIANFAKCGGGVPHMSFELHMPASQKGGGAGGTCMYIYSCINMYK